MNLSIGNGRPSQCTTEMTQMKKVLNERLHLKLADASAGS